MLGDYVAGYDSACSITGVEAAAVVPIMVLVELGGADWALHGWEPDRAGYARSVQTIDWITRRFEALTAAASR